MKLIFHKNEVHSFCTPDPTTVSPWEDLYHRWRSIAELLVGYQQVLATLANQILEVEVFSHKVIKTKNQVAEAVVCG